MKKPKEEIVEKAIKDLQEFVQSKNGICRCIDVLNYCIGYFKTAGSVPVEVLNYINNLAITDMIRY